MDGEARGEVVTALDARRNGARADQPVRECQRGHVHGLRLRLRHGRHEPLDLVAHDGQHALEVAPARGHRRLHHLEHRLEGIVRGDGLVVPAVGVRGVLLLLVLQVLADGEQRRLVLLRLVGDLLLEAGEVVEDLRLVHVRHRGEQHGRGAHDFVPRGGAPESGVVRRRGEVPHDGAERIAASLRRQRRHGGVLERGLGSSRVRLQPRVKRVGELVVVASKGVHVVQRVLVRGGQVGVLDGRGRRGLRLLRDLRGGPRVAEPVQLLGQSLHLCLKLGNTGVRPRRRLRLQRLELLRAVGELGLERLDVLLAHRLL